MPEGESCYRNNTDVTDNALLVPHAPSPMPYRLTVHKGELVCPQQPSYSLDSVHGGTRPAVATQCGLCTVLPNPGGSAHAHELGWLWSRANFSRGLCGARSPAGRQTWPCTRITTTRSAVQRRHRELALYPQSPWPYGPTPHHRPKPDSSPRNPGLNLAHPPCHPPRRRLGRVSALGSSNNLAPTPHPPGCPAGPGAKPHSATAFP